MRHLHERTNFTSILHVRASDRSAYTHKLNFEWDTAEALFSRLPSGRWLRDVELEGSLDYVATGLPKAGDVIGVKDS
jgi:hypothetical protein